MKEYKSFRRVILYYILIIYIYNTLYFESRLVSVLYRLLA